MHKYFIKINIFILTFISSVLFIKTGFSQAVSLTALGSAYTQDFNTLSNVAGSTTNNLTITGWFLTESGAGARDNEQYSVDTGGSTTGDMYSYGSAGSTERALGELRSGTLIPIFGSCYTNNTGSTINNLAIAYTGEQWRLGTAARTDQVNFEYSTNATDLVTGTWTGVSTLNFTAPVTTTTGAKDGNAAVNRTALSATIGSLSIPAGATFWIRWTDTDATGADDGLAVDDFSLTPSADIPSLSISDVTLSEGNSGSTIFNFTISLSGPAGASGVTFDIATADNSAISPVDFNSSSLTSQTIATGNTTYTFSVVVNGDVNVEADETFFVNVTNISNATVSDAQGLGTIISDDVTPLIITQPQSAIVCAGDPVSFSAAASGIPLPAAQWQVSMDGGLTWNDLTATANTYTHIPSISENGNTYRVIYTNGVGADTSDAALLTVNPVYLVSNPQAICANASYTINGHTYSAIGNYNDTLNTYLGCDSIIVTQITHSPVYTTNNPQVICAGTSYVINSHAYIAAGTYKDTLQTYLGCDSIIVTQLSVNPVFSTNNPQTICSNSAYIINGHSYTTAGTYKDTLETHLGCDSIIVTQLSVNSSYTSNNPQTICSGGTYTYNGNTYSSAGNYRDTLQTYLGCDSIIVTQLTVNPVYIINNPQSICNGSSYIFNGNTYNSMGNYRDTLLTYLGCDSIVLTQLSVNPVFTVNNPQTICSGSSYVFNGHVYTAAGNYNDTLQGYLGCDSIVVTQLSVNPLYTTYNPQALCNGYSYNFNGNTYTTAGNFNDTLVSQYGCDSIIVTQLTVNAVFTDNPQTICTNNSYSINGNTYSSAGDYNDTLLTYLGCDSIITTHLTVNGNFISYNQQVICSGNVYVINGHTYSAEGDYNDTLQTFLGCDSIVVTQLSIAHSVDISTSLVNDTISSNTTGVAYQWLNCNNGYALIPGETGQQYVPASSGSYAVEITANGCSDTSACVSVVITNHRSAEADLNMVIYPNPNNGEFILKANTNGSYNIVNELGQKIQTLKLNAANNYTIRIRDLNPGIYFITGYNDDLILKQKIIVVQ